MSNTTLVTNEEKIAAALYAHQSFLKHRDNISVDMAIRAYCLDKENTTELYDEQATVIVDMLTDLMHLIASTQRPNDYGIIVIPMDTLKTDDYDDYISALVDYIKPKGTFTLAMFQTISSHFTAEQNDTIDAS